MSSVSLAQTNPDTLTIEFIDERIDVIKDESTIDEALKSEALDYLDRARDTLLAKSRRAEQVAAFQSTAGNLDRLLAEIEERHLELESSGDEWGENVSVQELESGLSLTIAERQIVEEELLRLRARSLILDNRAAEIADEVIAARDELELLSGSPDINRERPGEPVEFARWLFAWSSLQERQAAVSDLQKELETLPAQQSLVTARLSLLETEILRSDDIIERLRQRLSASALGRAEIAIQTAQAHLEEFSGARPALLEFARENLELSQAVKASILRRAALERRIRETDREANALDQSADTVRLVLGSGQLSDETAALLKTVRSAMPDRAEINAILFQTEVDRGDIQLRLIVWLDQLRTLDDTAGLLNRFRDNGDSSTQLVETPADAVTRLVDFRRSQLDLLIDGARQESELISERELALAELGQQSGDLANLIDRRLLWLRTSERVNWSWFDQISGGIAWIFSPASWAGAFGALLSGTMANPGAVGFFALILLSLVALRRWFLATLDRLAENVGHVGRDTYWTTPFAMVVTALLALPIPLTISISAWLMSNSGATPQAFTQGLSQTLTVLGSVLLVLYLFQDMCRPTGLFERHFNWTETARNRLQANLRWFVRLQAVAILVFGLTVFSSPPGIEYGLGVAAFIVASVGLAALTFQFLKPKNGIVSELETGPTMSWLLKLLFPIAVLEPLLVGALPLFGFFDTATQLQFKVLQSGALVLGGSVLYGLAVRMFMVGNRRFALDKAIKRRARQEAARASEPEIEASGDAIVYDADDSLPDAELISEQVRAILKILTVGTVAIAMWALWSPIIPALGIVGDVSLWMRTVTLNGNEVREAVTLLDLLTAVLFLTLSVFAVRNIGGVLEIGIFEPFGLDSGSRYAAATITRYFIIAAAIIFCFSYLGAEWSELQWIIAALGVGLGFGLQEIVANFVSGLIILFERPIRVGDVVTIGDLSGTVRSIRIRATTITDFENRQVILPNKTIITENVTNWTLEDDVTRLLLTVGVAYGTDIDSVRTIILKTVSDHPDVLEKPPPTVFFMAHGDSALQFEVRLFVGMPAKRLPTTHALNAAINAALKANDIQIPFPQTDVHVSMTDQAKT